MKYISRALAWIAVALFLLSAVYVLAYFALLKPYAINGLGGVHRGPAYRWINSAETERFFKPINDLDRMIRPGFWYQPGPHDPSL